ncbi:MAG: hypothetical protein QOE37_821 [Microbacteriaceae bacterium]|nr:hypothetical protein [Microbacteriaceae bacterium]
MPAFLDLPSARIAYEVIGEADAQRTVLVTHSLAASREWEDEAGILNWPTISDGGNRLVRFDARGHGESAGEPGQERYRWPFLAEDLVALADATSPEEPVDALGESTGCGIVLWAALASPSRLRRLVLVIPPTRGRAREQQAELYRGMAELIELRGMEAWLRLLSVAPPAPILRAGGWTRPARVTVAEALLPSVLRGAADSTFPDEDALRTIQQPTLILAWETDPSHPVETATYLAEQLPNGVVEVATTPEEVRGWSRRISEFLAAPEAP